MFNVREATVKDAEEVAKVHVDSWRSTYKDLVKEEDLAQETSYENRKVFWETILKSQLTKQILYVAENREHQVVGFVSGGPERSKKFPYEGEIYAIYILEEYQGQGIGKKLLTSFMHKAMEMDYESILVWVLTANPSSQFYEYFGAKPIDAEEITIGEGTYEETAYGWDDVRPLIQ
ncbi:GNAT family N-acetyltransferase [Salinibacillus xinjiangensis]|uniref:GNAT family N-acetyltransferase n=1 Tax=Salinibacillus xinjiangensis TaxID=1229268 RepID=A0A6G1X7B1_9BACI|nr:GNAT family N-acetyltransferase [Salinibacillus xinjiangensis]MRG86893.1 GNAT family N-acetyltransferase [Salinibacillus xinjiangensis]